MQAIILAAGVGARLEPSGHRAPKCLLRFGGVSLLERHLGNLVSLGIDDIRVCVGHESDTVLGEIADSEYDAHVSTVINPDFREGSIVSLWTMRGALRHGGDVVLMDADVLYAPEILGRLARRSGSCLAMDRGFTPGDEPVKVCVAGGRVVEFSKKVAPDLRFDTQGESVGFFRFAAPQAADLAGRLERMLVAGGRALPYEDAVRDLILADPAAFFVEDVTGLPWIEIDFPEDVARARDVVLPAIDAH